MLAAEDVSGDAHCMHAFPTAHCRAGWDCATNCKSRFRILRYLRGVVGETG